MDKEIIIDGIDVSGCNFRLEREGKQKCECTHATGFGVICDCEKWHNCYYKQLKRLEQEIAELKAYKDVNEDFKTAWEELKAENEALIEGLGIANKYVNKYHKTLQEIKAIVANICNGCTSECDCDEDCNYFLIIEALTKAEEE